MKTILLSIALVLTVGTSNSQDTQDFSIIMPGTNTVSSATAFSVIVTKEDAADVKWITTSEKNISHFEVEKSLDGLNYQMTGIVFAFGNTDETVNYRFIDKKIDTKKPVIVYYRLRQVNNDRSNAFSAVVPVRTDKTL